MEKEKCKINELFSNAALEFWKCGNKLEEIVPSEHSYFAASVALNELYAMGLDTISEFEIAENIDPESLHALLAAARMEIHRYLCETFAKGEFILPKGEDLYMHCAVVGGMCNLARIIFADMCSGE